MIVITEPLRRVESAQASIVAATPTTTAITLALQNLAEAIMEARVEVLMNLDTSAGDDDFKTIATFLDRVRVVLHTILKAKNKLNEDIAVLVKARLTIDLLATYRTIHTAVTGASKMSLPTPDATTLPDMLQRFQQELGNLAETVEKLARKYA